MRTCDAVSAEKAVQRFVELGYLNDEEFAKELAEHLFTVKNYSAGNVRSELLKRGVDRDIVASVIADNDTDPVDSLVNIINKKYLRKLNEDGGRQKVTAALARKGFSYSDIKSAFYRIENEE